MLKKGKKKCSHVHNSPLNQKVCVYKTSMLMSGWGGKKKLNFELNAKQP